MPHRSIALCAGVLGLAASAGWAQDGSNVKLDSPEGRVLLVTEQPHGKNAMHEHKINRVMIYLGDGRMRFTTAAGKTETIEFKAGDVRWSPAEGPHTSESIGDKPFQIVEIELKNKPSSSGKISSDLDPLKVDAKHYKLEFENDQVRVLRVHFGPNEKGVLHEHKLKHWVVYLNDQARGKKGEVRLDEAMTHTEQNPLDHDVERIAVDIK